MYIFGAFKMLMKKELIMVLNMNKRIKVKISKEIQRNNL